jgi:chromosome segregation ATPase
MINVDALAAENGMAHGREKPVKAIDVLRERQRNVIRAEEVRDVYHAVEEKAKTAESRLEDVFGSLQGKVTVLRSTIEDLQVLVSDTTALREKFENESRDVESESRVKIESFETFEAQSAAIAECEKRIADGRRRVVAANERLEKAKIRVEDWEKREDEWQKRTSSTLNHAQLDTTLTFHDSTITSRLDHCTSCLRGTHYSIGYPKVATYHAEAERGRRYLPSST